MASHRQDQHAAVPRDLHHMQVQISWWAFIGHHLEASCTHLTCDMPGLGSFLLIGMDHLGVDTMELAFTCMVTCAYASQQRAITKAICTSSRASSASLSAAEPHLSHHETHACSRCCILVGVRNWNGIFATSICATSSDRSTGQYHAHAGFHEIL